MDSNMFFYRIRIVPIKCLFKTSGNETGLALPASPERGPLVEIEFEFGRTSEIDAYIEILDKDPSSEYTFKTRQNNVSYIDTNPFEFI